MDRRQLIGLTGALGLGTLLGGCAIPAISSGVTQFADAVVPPPDKGEPVGTPLAAFAEDLNRRLAPTTKNLIWSPWSVAMVLAMVRDGAAGATASEFDKLLRADASFDAALADGWRRMAHAEGDPLHAANSVWGQAGMTWKTPFRDKLTALSASFKVADFKARASQVEEEINAWVSDHTAKKIPKLLDGDVDSTNRLVLVNAVHFKAPWQTEFIDLPKAPFRAPGKQVDTPYLQGSEPFQGWRADGWTLASVPCKGLEFNLNVALPDDPAANPASLPMEVLLGSASIDPGFSSILIALTMPAWKQRFEAHLNEVLIAAGIPTAFTPSADFSAMTDDDRLHLGFVVHEAVVEVTAKGIEAAAATAAGMRASGMLAEPIKLVLDRPFAYALVHRTTRTPLFVGQVADPSAES